MSAGSSGRGEAGPGTAGARHDGDPGALSGAMPRGLLRRRGRAMRARCSSADAAACVRRRVPGACFDGEGDALKGRRKRVNEPRVLTKKSRAKGEGRRRGEGGEDAERGGGRWRKSKENNGSCNKDRIRGNDKRSAKAGTIERSVCVVCLDNKNNRRIKTC